VAEDERTDPELYASVYQALPIQAKRRARRLGWIFSVAAVALLPWIVYLAISLPRRDLDTHYRAAWVGFDCLLVFAIVRTAYMAFRVDLRVQIPAVATATLLIVDAWFDIATSDGRAAIFRALLLAVFFEIPAAVFSIYVSRQVSHQVLLLAGHGGSPTGAPESEPGTDPRGGPPRPTG
jgi:hypothetical protein